MDKSSLYIGTKAIMAWPQEKDGQPGYGVQYVVDGYVSWSPKEVFELAYRKSGQLTFGHALQVLKDGKRIARSGWNEKNMWLVLVPGSSNLTVDEGRPLAKAGLQIGTKFDYLPHIDMWTAQGNLVPWLASQTDMLSEDWCIVD